MINVKSLWRKLDFDDSEIHSLNSRRGIVVFSGGFDSTVALWWAMNHYAEISILILDYNQFHREELFCAQRIASLSGVKTNIVKLDIPMDFWGINNNLTRGQAGLMTSIAALDVGIDGADIVHGILRTDNYPDCNREYLDTLAGILPNTKDLGAIGIATPLRAVKDKQAACILGFLYGAPINWTWSCRNPQGGKPCGKCSPCQSRLEVWKDIGYRYGITQDYINQWQNVLGSPAHPVFQKPSKKLSILIQAFIEMGGLQYCSSGWRYFDPVGKERIATWVRNPNAIDFNGKEAGSSCNFVEIHGLARDGSLWQLVICQDHAVAYTDNIPDLEIVEDYLNNELIKQTISEKL